MAMLILDSFEERRIKRERAKSRVDRFDEVWDGVYVVGPVRDNQHQWLVGEISFTLEKEFGARSGTRIFCGCYVSDRTEGWDQNYRFPDVAVFLKGGAAKDCESHWFGGPGFAVEVVSPNDRSRDKLEFYFRVGVRELLIVDRKPWKLELYRNDGESLRLQGVCTPTRPKPLDSSVIPFRFSLAPGRPRPRLLVVRHSDGHTTRI
jgi:Uma2 family endonuclease